MVGRVNKILILQFNDDYVDLGLTSRNLWGTRNLGATSPEAVGDY